MITKRWKRPSVPAHTNKRTTVRAQRKARTTGLPDQPRRLRSGWRGRGRVIKPG